MQRMAMVLALVVTPFAAAAEDTPDIRGFGLHGLHWGMTDAQVQAVYPVLPPPPSTTVLNQTDLRLPIQNFGGCRFIVALWFDATTLARVAVDRHPAEPIAKCAAVLKREMQAQYGGNTAPRTTPDGNLEWSGPTTTAIYIDLLQYGGRAEIKKNGAPPLLIYDVAGPIKGASYPPRQTVENGALTLARWTHLNPPWHEVDFLEQAPDGATRSGSTLTLPRAGKAPILLTNDERACNGADATPVDACLRYHFITHLRTRHTYVVAKSSYESCADILLIDDRTARQTTLAEVPVFSPDGQRLLVQNECEADGSASTNHLEIWKRDSDGWKLEWAYTDKQAYAADPALKNIFHSRVNFWRDNSMTLSFWADTGAPTKQRWTGTLSLGAKGWQLDAPPLTSP